MNEPGPVSIVLKGLEGNDLHRMSDVQMFLHEHSIAAMDTWWLVFFGTLFIALAIGYRKGNVS